ncbi:MAG: serine/threonine protein kinase, partial [Kiritimatiellae bacterium]|nr:serine/threonine protein kinase [Kiritimatiellia bacterium]
MSDHTDPTPAPGSHREEREVPVIPGYQIEAVAGETTSTQSWEALQISLDRHVVLLTLKVALVDDPSKVAHFEDVARIVARLHHRNIVSIIDIAKTEHGLPYVVMEKIEGRRLSEVLHNDGPLPPERAAKVVLQLADALDGAWKQSGFVHRNLKPDNVYVLPDGAAKISSFMYATVIRPGADPLAADGGMLVGTPNYMPPEQIDCLRSIDFHADIYSVGALFYQALTGQAPFREERNDYMRIFELQKEGTIPAPSDLDPKVPVAFSRIIQKMMAKRPGDRYAFWQDVIEDVHRALAGRDLYVPGGGEWVSPRSTVADAAPQPEPAPEPAAAKGKPKG